MELKSLIVLDKVYTYLQMNPRYWQFKLRKIQSYHHGRNIKLNKHVANKIHYNFDSTELLLERVNVWNN